MHVAFELILVKKNELTIERMARLLEVSRSGFYSWLGRTPPVRAVRALRALRALRTEQKVVWFHGGSDEVSGSAKILANLREDGEIIFRKKVVEIMRRLGLKAICPKRWRTTTVINSADAYPINAVKREWEAGALNQVWDGHIYLRTSWIPAIIAAP